MEKYEEHTDLEGLRQYRVIKTDETRIRKIFTWLPLWLNRLSWLQNIEVLERKEMVSELLFDDGDTYQSYWTPPKEEWVKEEIILKKNTMEIIRGTEDCDHSDSGFVVLDDDGAHYECYNCGYEWVERSTQIEDEEDEEEINEQDEEEDDFEEDEDDDFEEDEIDPRNL